MRIGVPKEIKNHEYRVGLTPESVGLLVHQGHEVFVEAGAGLGIAADDDAYIAEGAKIAPDAATIFQTSEMIVKVKEPQPAERLEESRIGEGTELHDRRSTPIEVERLEPVECCVGHRLVGEAHRLVGPRAGVIPRHDTTAEPLRLDRHGSGALGLAELLGTSDLERGEGADAVTND